MALPCVRNFLEANVIVEKAACSQLCSLAAYNSKARAHVYTFKDTHTHARTRTRTHTPHMPACTQLLRQEVETYGEIKQELAVLAEAFQVRTGTARLLSLHGLRGCKRDLPKRCKGPPQKMLRPYIRMQGSSQKDVRTSSCVLALA